MRPTRSAGLICLTTAALLGATVTANAAPLHEPLSQSTITVELSPAAGDAPTRALITGPSGFRNEITASTVLRGLAPGTYTLTGEVGVGRLGAVAPKPASSTVTVGFADTVVLGVNYFPAQAPAATQGSPGDFALQTLDAGLPVRWNPCEAITWGLSADSPQTEHDRIAAAFDTASLATGITFREAAAGADPQVSVQLQSVPGDRVKGEGEMHFRSDGTGSRQLPYAGSIQASLGTETTPELRTALYLHEIGHVLGITHVADEPEVMHDVVDEADATGYKAGDLAGLAQVGLAAGCLNRPPTPLDARVRMTGNDVAVAWLQPASSNAVQRSWLRLRNAKDSSGVYIDMPLDPDAKPTVRQGPQYVRIPRPSDFCAQGATPELVVANQNATTVTALAVSGCPAGPGSR